MLRKAKALFQTIILITALFAITVFDAFPVTAAEDVCCEKTKQGEYCQYTSSDQCDPAFAQAASACSQTQFCGDVCCQETAGRCNRKVGLSRCIASDGISFQDATCGSVAICALGCCQIGNNYRLTTEEQCRQLSHVYSQLADTDNFDETIQDEVQCLQQAQNTEEGCCVLQDGTCSFTAQNLCNTAGATARNGGPGFYANIMCSSPSVQCACTPHAKKGCLQDDVYWFDSCGNREELVEACKENSICQAEEKDARCINMDCSSTQAYPRNPHDPKIGTGGTRKHGESWCVYEGPTGNFRDWPGTRHYAHSCFQGKELVEPCRDYREEICVQSEIAYQDSSYAQARCIYNDIEDTALREKATTVSRGGKFWKGAQTEEQPGLEVQRQCRKHSSTCTVVYVKKDGWSDWKCEQNCQCEEQSYIDKAANYCRAAGDCGPDYNVLEKRTAHGIRIRWSGDIEGPTPTKISERQWNIWKKYGVYGGVKHISQSLTFTAQQPEAQDIIRIMAQQSLVTFGISTVATTIAYSLVTGTAFSAALQTVLGTHFVSLQSVGGLFLGGGLNNLITGTATVGAGTGIPAGAIVTSGTINIPAGATVTIGETTYTASEVTSLAVGENGIVVDGFLEAGETTIVDEVVSGSVQVGEGGATAVTESATITPGTNLATTLGVGFGALMVVYGILTGDMGTAISGLLMAAGALLIPGIGAIIGALLGTVINLVMGGAEYAMKTVTVTCNSWKPPVGGKDCVKCDDDPMHPCTEYKCRSLGTACTLINEGTTAQACVDDDPDDIAHPIIQPDLSYMQGYDVQLTAQGFMIVNVIPAFTGARIGILTDELATCRYDSKHTRDFEEMEEAFDELYEQEHRLALALPPQRSFTYYVRCEDRQGNSNLAEYEITLQTQREPDLTPPLIQGFSLENPAYVAKGITDLPVGVYLNEPATCKWSKQDQPYGEMKDITLCERAADPQSTPYSCLGLVKEIQQEQKNIYYFRCQDLAGNAQELSTTLEVMGTHPLVITRVSPSGELFSSHTTLTVNTNGGAEQGKAICGFSRVPGNYIEFFTTNSALHSQDLKNLQLGTYTYHVQCKDKAGNTAQAQTSFVVTVDQQAPRLLHIYRDSTHVHVIFDEPARCTAQTTPLTTVSSSSPLEKEHSIPIQGKDLYLQCMDKDGNTGPLLRIIL